MIWPMMFPIKFSTRQVAPLMILFAKAPRALPISPSRFCRILMNKQEIVSNVSFFARLAIYLVDNGANPDALLIRNVVFLITHRLISCTNPARLFAFSKAVSFVRFAIC